MQDLVSVNTRETFGSIKSVTPQIAEVVIFDDVVVDMEKALNLHRVIKKMFIANYALLFNDKHSYTYTRETQRYMSKLRHLKGMATLQQMRFTDIAEQYMRIANESQDWNLKVFYDRKSAIEWLEGRLAVQ